jgi:hypothetical protein
MIIMVKVSFLWCNRFFLHNIFWPLRKMSVVLEVFMALSMIAGAYGL